MPTLPDGRKADIVLNPLGIISRMNIGQLFELHLAMALHDLKQIVKEKYEKKEDQKAIYDYILGFIKIIDKTKDNNYTDQMIKFFERTKIEDFIKNIDNFFIIQPPFESIGVEELNLALTYTGTKFEYECFDPIQNKILPNKIAFGYQYIVKMNHIAQDKIAVRGVGPYSAKTSQPLGGKARKGGQRLGEMEMWAVIAHGSHKNLHEFLTTKSDSIKLRNQYISEKMCNDTMLLDAEDDNVSQSLRYLQNSLKVFSLDYPLNEQGVEYHE
jgi:DNA-directed RNA polymerase subunit beta